MRTLFVLALALIASLQAMPAHAGICSWNVINQSNPNQTVDFGGSNTTIELRIEVTANCTGTPENPQIFLSSGGAGDPDPTPGGIYPDLADAWASYDAPILVGIGEVIPDGETANFHYLRYAYWNSGIFQTLAAGTYNLSMSLMACAADECQTFPVSADVIVNSYCDMSTNITQQHIDFGNIGGANLENLAPQSGLLSTKCSEVNGGNYSITLSGGNNYNGTRNMTNGFDMLPYVLLNGASLWDPGTEVYVPGDGQNHVTEVGAHTVPTTAPLSSGTYFDSVIVTVTY